MSNDGFNSGYQCRTCQKNKIQKRDCNVCEECIEELRDLRIKYPGRLAELKQAYDDRDHYIDVARGLIEERDAWHKACAVLYGECKEGGSRGRPMDLIPKRAWSMIVELIAAAEAD